MKKVFQKNQMIIMTLAVVIAVAGYVNYSQKYDSAGTKNGKTKTVSSPLECASIVVMFSLPFSLISSGIWITDIPFAVKASLHVFQHSARSAYLLLKNGLLLLFFAPSICPCAFAKAAASSLICSLFNIGQTSSLLFYFR